jgi:hypothetical protein
VWGVVPGSKLTRGAYTRPAAGILTLYREYNDVLRERADVGAGDRKTGAG